MGYVAALPLIRLELFTLGGKAVVPSDVCFLVLVALATISGAWRRPSRSLIVVALLPPLATAAVSLFGNTDSAPAVTEIARTAYSMVTLLALACLDLDRQRQQLAVRTWTLTATAVCIIGLVAFMAVVFFGAPVNPLARPNSPNLGPNVIRVSGVLATNALTLYLLMAGAFSAYLARFGDSDRERRFGTATLLLEAFIVLIALSRGAIGFMLAMTVLAWRSDLAPAWLSRCRAAVGVVAALLVIAGIAVTLWAVFPVSLSSDSKGGRTIDWNRRPNAYNVLHRAGLRMFAAHPILGVGPGTFGARLADFTTPEERARAWPPIDPGRNWSPHSTWIGLAAEGGAVLLSSWGCLFVLLATRLVDARPPVSHSAYVGLALAGMLVNGLHVDMIHLKFIWASLGFALNERT